MQNYLEGHYKKEGVLMYFEPVEIFTEYEDADVYSEAIDIKI